MDVHVWKFILEKTETDIYLPQAIWNNRRAEMSFWNMMPHSTKLGCIYTESWDACLNLTFHISLPVILDFLYLPLYKYILKCQKHKHKSEPIELSSFACILLYTTFVVLKKVFLSLRGRGHNYLQLFREGGGHFIPSFSTWWMPKVLEDLT